MKRLPRVFSALMVAAVIAVSIPPYQATPGRVATARAQTATLALNPDSGPAPSVSGDISGSGWCLIHRGVAVTGEGVTGTVSLERGNLSGSFTVTGSPGQTVRISVTASCADGSQIVTESFRFDDPTPVPRPTPTPTAFSTPTPTATPTAFSTATPTATATATARPTNTSTPTPTATATATARPTNTSTPTATATARSTNTSTPTATSTRPAEPTATATATRPAGGANPTATPSPTPAPQPGTGTVRVMGCTPPASAVSVRMTYAGGTAPPAALVDLNLPAVQAPSPQVFTFLLPPEAPPGTLFDLVPQVNDPSCPPSSAEPVLWDPAAADSASLFLPVGESVLEASSHGGLLPDGITATWVTQWKLKTNIWALKQIFRLSSTSQFDGVRWQVSLHPFSGGFDPLDPDPPGMLAFGDVTCTPGTACIYTVDFSTFMPQPAAQQKTPKKKTAWSSKAAGAVFEPVPLFQVAQAVALQKGGPPAPPSSSAEAKLSPQAVAGSAVADVLFAAPKDFYFRAIPMSGETLLGPQSNTVILHWVGPYDGPNLDNIKIVNCSKTPEDPYCKAQLPKPSNYTVEILSYHGWIPPVAGHYGCFLVTETTTVVGVFGQKVTYNAGQKLCEPEPEEPSFLEAVVDFVVDAVNWVSNAYADLKDAVINFVSQFVPAAFCDKTCLEIALNAGLAALGIPPSLPNFDQLMDQGLDYLASTAVEQIGIPKEIQDLAAGPAKDIAIEEFKKTAEEEIKKGVKAGIAEMQKALSSQVAWIADGVPIKPDPQGEYQPPALTFRVTRKPGSGTCSGNIVVGGTVTNTTPAGIEELDGELSAPLYVGKAVPLPPLAEGESVTTPVVLTPYLDYGFPNAKYWSYYHAVDGWSDLYYGGIAELRAIGNSCIGGATLKTPAEGILLGATTSP